MYHTFQVWALCWTPIFKSVTLRSGSARRGQDIAHLLSGARARLGRKLEIQREELAACAGGDAYKLYADLITANLYVIRRGMGQVRVQNYYSEAAEEMTIVLDPRLTPAQNAQRMYKKYTKSKNAKVYLSEQIRLAEEELRYLDTVAEALERAETESDLNEIRQEMAQSGYAARTPAAKNAKRPERYAADGISLGERI